MTTLSPAKVRARAGSTIEGQVRLLASQPVVILNMFYSGLGIARDMAGKGVRVKHCTCFPSGDGQLTTVVR